MRLVLILAALALVVPGAHAQMRPQAILTDTGTPASPSAVHSVALTIAGYARAETNATDLVLNVDPGSDMMEASHTATLSFATNYAVGQQVNVVVNGDLDGAVLEVVPVPGSLVVERMARTGSVGTTGAVSFTEPGSQPVITGLGQVVATMEVHYTLRALSSVTTPGPRSVTVTYTITS